MTPWEELREKELASRASMERDLPGFYDRHPNYAMSRIGDGYQYGHEIEGYGTVVGWCTLHRPHKTRAGAAACGKRFEDGHPPRLIDRIRLRISRDSHS